MNFTPLSPKFYTESFGIGSITPGDFNSHIGEIIHKSQMEEMESNNTFPIEVFPADFKDLIIESQKALNYPPDYTGTAILSAVSTAIGTSASIKVKNKWYEFANLYIAIVGNAGTNKSHPLSLAFEPFNEIDKQEIQKYTALLEEYDHFDSLSKKEKSEISVIPTKPKLVKSILQNFSPESLHQRLSDNHRGCAVVNDELATFFDLMNNYSKGDQASIYLSFYNNKPTSIDRVSKPIPLFITLPFINIIGSIQPRMLKRMFPLHKTDNGFLQRFLFAFPTDNIKYPMNDNQLNDEVVKRYNDFISDYIRNHPVSINDETGKPDSKVLGWNEESKLFLYNWQNSNTIEVNKYLGTIKAEVISKFDNHFVRLALILQLMENSDSDHISLNAVKGSAKLCTYFMRNAMKVLSIVQSPVPIKDVLPSNKLEFLKALPDEFATHIAVTTGGDYGISERAVKSFLGDNTIFENFKHGFYKKKI